MPSTVHFSKIKDEIVRNLRKATTNIKVAVAWLTDEDIIRRLTQRAEDGLNVQIVISYSKENFRNTGKFKEFLRSGGQLYVASPKFLHHKFCIIDNKLILNGSYNWTYYAAGSEENLLVVTIDNANQEDEKLLMAFEAKHKFFCEKASKKIDHISDLNQFYEQGKEATLILSKLDEQEINLRQELEDDVKKSFAEARSLGIGVSEYLLDRMKIDGGGVEFIKRILYDEMTSGEMKSGFRKLEDCIPHRVDLSLEFLASRPKYQQLFSDKEVEFCQKLMRKYQL